jgi:hypothetical protein
VVIESGRGKLLVFARSICIRYIELRDGGTDSVHQHDVLREGGHAEHHAEQEDELLHKATLNHAP